MNLKEIWKQVVVVLVPFGLSWLINSSFFMMDLYSRLVWPFAITMTLYWWWAGCYFGKRYNHSVKGYLIGNALWCILMLIYVYEFFVMSDATRHMIPAVYSQCYAGFFIPYASAMMSLSDTLNGTVLQLVAYGMMLLVFTGGYVSKKR